MKKNNTWLKTFLETDTPTKHLLANISIKVRSEQFNTFLKLLKPDSKSTVVDVGVTSDKTLKDSNLFERLYKYPENITAVTIEDQKKFKLLFPKIKVLKVLPGEKLPFENNSFDIAVSWATLEHVGDYNEQMIFLNEMLRIGKKVFITTPYRGALYEPHTGFFLLHWLPLGVFRYICKLTHRSFWGTSSNLNPLFIKDLNRMKLFRRVKISIFKTFGFLPSHILITG